MTCTGLSIHISTLYSLVYVFNVFLMWTQKHWIEKKQAFLSNVWFINYCKFIYLFICTKVVDTKTTLLSLYTKVI